tara:strand:- start:3288 stop:5012 length:1725 start_codon:yes stop_codon:yes gene_type:complete
MKTLIRQSLKPVRSPKTKRIASIKTGTLRDSHLPLIFNKWFPDSVKELESIKLPKPKKIGISGPDSAASPLGILGLLGGVAFSGGGIGGGIIPSLISGAGSLLSGAGAIASRAPVLATQAARLVTRLPARVLKTLLRLGAAGISRLLFGKRRVPATRGRVRGGTQRTGTRAAVRSPLRIGINPAVAGSGNVNVSTRGTLRGSNPGGATRARSSFRLESARAQVPAARPTVRGGLLGRAQNVLLQQKASLQTGTNTVATRMGVSPGVQRGLYRAPGQIRAAGTATMNVVRSGTQGVRSGLSAVRAAFTAVKRTVSKIPIIGSLLVGLFTYYEDADGDGQPDRNVTKSLFTTAGTALGGLLGSFIPIPFLGTLIGSYAGTYVGELIYDLINGKGWQPSTTKVVNDMKALMNFGGRIVDWIKGSASKFYEGIPKNTFNIPFVGEVKVPKFEFVLNPLAMGKLLFDSVFGGFDFGGAMSSAGEAVSNMAGAADRAITGVLGYEEQPVTPLTPEAEQALSGNNTVIINNGNAGGQTGEPTFVPVPMHDDPSYPMGQMVGDNSAVLNSTMDVLLSTKLDQ